jgi:hypothetical protein
LNGDLANSSVSVSWIRVDGQNRNYPYLANAAYKSLTLVDQQTGLRVSVLSHPNAQLVVEPLANESGELQALLQNGLQDDDVLLRAYHIWLRLPDGNSATFDGSAIVSLPLQDTEIGEFGNAVLHTVGTDSYRRHSGGTTEGGLHTITVTSFSPFALIRIGEPVNNSGVPNPGGIPATGDADIPLWSLTLLLMMAGCALVLGVHIRDRSRKTKRKQ